MASVTLPDVKCIKETKLAILCEIEGEEHWIPKSVIDDDSEVYETDTDGKLIIPEWFATKEGLG